MSFEHTKWIEKSNSDKSLVHCYARFRAMQVGQYLLAREVEFITQSLGDKYTQNWLIDAGCGNGEISLQLLAQGYQVLGVDNDLLALAAFRQRSCEVPLIQCDCLYLPFEDSSLDCIIAIHCFDHLDRLQFLCECMRVLSQGGLLIFDALNRHSYKLSLKRLLHMNSIKSRPEFLEKYINVFSCREVQRALAGAGFDIQSVSGYGWIPFSVDSESRLVNQAAWIEQLLRLDRFPNVSPRILVAAQK